MKKNEWIESRIADLLPCPYYHMVFTLPHEFNKLMMSNKKAVYDLLFRSASQTLLNYGQNEEFLGGTPGITMVLHTWGQKLDYHVHVHCIVTGGGVDNNNNWLQPKRSNNKFLFPESGMRTMYKAIFLKGLGELSAAGDMNTGDKEVQQAIKKAGYKKWKVYAKAPFGGPEQVIKYLGRYTHKTAITHHRILSVSQGVVKFKYKDYNDANKMKETELTEQEFLRRFELHILPKRFVRIRHYGFLRNQGKNARLQEIRESMNLEPAPLKVDIPASVKLLEKFGRDVMLCEKCGQGRYELVYTIRCGKLTYHRDTNSNDRAPPVKAEVESTR